MSGVGETESTWVASQATKKPGPNVLLVDDDACLCRALAAFLRKMNMTVHTAVTGQEALEALSRKEFDVMLLDLRMPNMDGLAVLRTLKDRRGGPTAIVHSAYLDVKTITTAMRAGAADVCEKPAEPAEIVRVIMSHAQRSVGDPCVGDDQCAGVERFVQSDRSHTLDRLIGTSAAISAVKYKLECVSAFPQVSVLIEGPTGTGKEVVARCIHELTCPKEPFVTINCAAIPEHLLESELFGHEAGAFTNARGARTGLMEHAGRGTIFLDEVGEMDQSLQTKLLRVLETGEFRRVGSNTIRRLHARVVSATNRSLSAYDQSTLRSDLYFRLAGYTINTPTLSSRIEDVEVLTRHFLSEFARIHDLGVIRIDAEALVLLSSYDWPGNVRELKRCVENLAIVARGGPIRGPDVASILSLRTERQDAESGSFPIFRQRPSVASIRLDHPAEPPTSLRSLPDLERQHILATFDESGGNLSRAARTLGIARSTLRERLRKYRRIA